jgi:hypothetical protein
MNLNKKIGFLLDNGLNPNFISSMNEGQVNTIYNRLVETKKETKEQAQQGVTTKITTEKVTTINTSALNSPQGVNVDGLNLQNQGGQLVARQMKEGEIAEKFESKAQQGLFWARCNKCKDDDCKWCKMAKEFSKSTSKKQYEKMPEKKHPEKTVKYKNKKTNEEFTMANYFDKLSSVYANNAMGKTIGNLTKENIEKIIEKNLKPTMKKRDLLKLIESGIKHKKSLNEDFYVGDMDEEFDFMSDTETDMPTRPKHRPDRTEDLPIGPDRTEDEPNWYEDEDEDDDIPRPRGEMGRLRMDDPGVLEPGIKPLIKPKEPDTAPEWEPDFDEPMSPDEDTEGEPQAKDRKNILNRFKDDFDKKISRMDKSTYKPIKYRKF